MFHLWVLVTAVETGYRISLFHKSDSVFVHLLADCAKRDGVFCSLGLEPIDRLDALSFAFDVVGGTGRASIEQHRLDRRGSRLALPDIGEALQSYGDAGSGASGRHLD